MRLNSHTNQNGMILVLAMFMLALLAMIGTASMMTSTTDIEIATGERQYAETFYRTQAAHSIAGEVMLAAMWDRGLGGFDTIDNEGNRVDMSDITDYTFAFRVIDDGFLLEPEDSVSKQTKHGTIRYWDVNSQEEDELPCPQEMAAEECQQLDKYVVGSIDFGLWSDIRLLGMHNGQQVVLGDIDIDRIGSRAMAGGGTEIGAKDLGIGSQLTVINYNIDARTRLENGSYFRSPSRQALGFRIVK